MEGSEGMIGRDVPPQMVYWLPGRSFSISAWIAAAISSTSSLGILQEPRKARGESVSFKFGRECQEGGRG